MERTETQRRILEVGKKEFLEKGFKDASLNQIVAEAGFTKGAFYGYYPDKTALFEDLVGETASELLTRFKAAQDDYFDLVPEGKAKTVWSFPPSTCTSLSRSCTTISTNSS